MDHSEGWFQSVREARLYYQRWRPAPSLARGTLIMVHGDWAHSGWYMNLPTHATPRGYAVYAYDRRGWGRSLQESGYPRSWRDHLDDLATFLALVHNEGPERPLFLIVHTGSAPLVLDYAMRSPDEIHGVCCVSPALDTSAAIPGALRMLLRLLSVVAPRRTIDVRRRVDAGMAFISHDAAFVKAAREDPLRNTRVLPRLLVEADPATGRLRRRPNSGRPSCSFSAARIACCHPPQAKPGLSAWGLLTRNCACTQGRTPTCSARRSRPRSSAISIAGWIAT